MPLVALLRSSVPDDVADDVHRGLTSQDVLDTALMLVARDGLTRVRADLAVAATALARLARTHRDSLMVGRTLTQHAVPTTFGLTAAQWLTGVQDAGEQVSDVLGRLPVQAGGAAGTRAAVDPPRAGSPTTSAVGAPVRRRPRPATGHDALAHPARAP